MRKALAKTYQLQQPPHKKNIDIDNVAVVDLTADIAAAVTTVSSDSSDSP